MEMMDTITIQVPHEQHVRLEQLAEQYNVSMDALVSACLATLTKRPEPDVQSVIAQVFDKNKELYQRLA